MKRIDPNLVLAAICIVLAFTLPACPVPIPLPDGDRDGIPDILDPCPQNPDPTCMPEPEPPVAYDCANPPALTGLVKVRRPLRERYIAVLKPTRAAMGLREIEDFANRFRGVSDVRPLMRAFAARVEARHLEALMADPAVAYVQQEGTKTWVALSWGLDRVDQRSRPLDGKYEPGSDCSGAHAFVIDTGCPTSGDLNKCSQTHPDFLGRYDPVCHTQVTFGGCTDRHGHASHVAGTIGGTKWGICKNITLHGERVLDENGSGTDSGVIAGVNNAVAFKRAHPDLPVVINMSLGGSPAPALDQATCDAIDAGISVAVAAGNSSEDARLSSPARVLQAITVGASDDRDTQASFSNYGPGLDLYAPGVDIESDTPTGGTATFSGTSMASPHVAGGAAMLMAHFKTETPAQIRDRLVAAATKDALDGTGPGSPNLLLYVKQEGGGGGALYPELLLHQCSATDPRWCLPDGKPVDHAGCIACCLGNDEITWDGWPLVTVEHVEWCRRVGRSTFWHRRPGPFIASDEYWDLGGRARPTRGPSARDLAATKRWVKAGIGGPYQEVGGKADLSRWNEGFFTYNDGVLDHVCSVGGHSEDDVMDGWRLKDGCQYSPWNAARNVQGEDHCGPRVGDPVQAAWIDKWVRHSGRYGCTTYQVSNESRLTGSAAQVAAWEQWVVGEIRAAETRYGYPRHPVLTNSGLDEVVRAPWIDGSNWHSIQYAAAVGKVTGCNEVNPAPADYPREYCAAQAGKAYLWGWRAELPLAKWKADLAGIAQARASGCPQPVACTLGTPTAREAAVQGKHPTIRVQRTTAGYTVKGQEPQAGKWISGTPVANFGKSYYCQPGMNWPEACASPPTPGPVAREGDPQRPPCEAAFLEAPCPVFSQERCTGTGEQCPITWDPYLVIDGVNQNHPDNVKAGCRESTWVRENGRIVKGEWWKATAHGKGFLRACNFDGSVCGTSTFEIDQ